MNRELLIQYVEILNRMEDTSYDISMSHNELDGSILGYMEEQASNDSELSVLLVDLKSLPSSERMARVNEFLKNREENVSKSSSEEEEIAKIFGIDVRDIQHLFLDSGSEVFYFYDSIMQRNVILENPKTGQTLIDQLEAIQEKNEEYQTEDDSKNARDMMVEEVLESNLELAFYSKEELDKHMNEIEKLNPDDMKKIKYLISHYEELMIVGINIENMIYLDANGEIHEATLDRDYNVVVSKPESADHSHEMLENQEMSDDEEKTSSDDTEMNSMFDEFDNQDDEKDNSNSIDHNKPKVFVKNNPDDKNSGFTNNALYFFFALLILLVVVFLVMIIF